MQATKDQIKAINAILARTGQMENKAEIISNATGGRTTHSSALTLEEAKGLLTALNVSKKNADPSKKMMGKLFAMAHEMGWIKEKLLVDKMGVRKTKDYTTLHTWVNKYGYLKKPLTQYSYAEMPKLVSQFEMGVYKHFLSKI